MKVSLIISHKMQNILSFCRLGRHNLCYKREMLLSVYFIQGRHCLPCYPGGGTSLRCWYLYTYRYFYASPLPFSFSINTMQCTCCIHSNNTIFFMHNKSKNKSASNSSAHLCFVHSFGVFYSINVTNHLPWVITAHTCIICFLTKKNPKNLPCIRKA